MTSPKTDTTTIFISIASYCDSLLKATIEDACAKAIYPERLRFGIVEQTDLDQRLPVAAMPQSKQIRYLAVDRLHSRGVGWARNVAMSLYQEEDWFFQIDSHMLFKSGWDAILLDSADECAQINPNFVISSYPNPFNFVEGVPVAQPVTDKILAHVVRGDAEFGEFLTLGFNALGVDQVTPVTGYHLGAGCLFAPGRFVSAFPYDPQIYFEGEEQVLAARLFTHGWDIFHVAALPIYHLYQRADAPTRPKHWSPEDDAARVEKWHELSLNAKRRVNAILLEQENYGVFGLGNKRTMKEYAKFSGIDYQQKTLSALAKSGPWAKAKPIKSQANPRKRTINIVEINPFQPRPFVFSDVAYYLFKSLAGLGQDVRLIHQPIDDTSQINIIIGGPKQLMETVDGLSSPYNVVFNFEQLRSDSQIVNQDYIAWLKDRIVFDYHTKNIAYLKEINGDVQAAYEIPLATSPLLNYFPETPNTGEVDVLFFGSPSERRTHVFDQLKNAGLKVELVSGAYGRELAPAIKRAKLILHVHFCQTALFPFMRFMQVIPCGIPILCENSTMSASTDWHGSGITFAPYEKLVEAVHEMLAKDPKVLNVAANKMIKFSRAIKPEDKIVKTLNDLDWYS